MPTLSERIRACLVLDPTTEAVLHVQTDRGADVSLVTLSPEDLCGIAEAEDAVALLAREQRMREETRLDLVEKTSALFLAQTNLAAEREKSAKGLACIQDAIQKTEALTKERDEARARVKELEGNAEPVAWAIGGERVLAVFTDRLVAQRAWGGRAEPLYRRPPKPAGEPVAWRWVANGEVVLRFLPASPEWAGVEALTPLYEAPPPMVVNAIGANVEAKPVRWATFDKHGFIASFATEGEARLGQTPRSSKGVEVAPLYRHPSALFIDLPALRQLANNVSGLTSPDEVRNTIRAAIGDKAGV